MYTCTVTSAVRNQFEMYTVCVYYIVYTFKPWKLKSHGLTNNSQPASNWLAGFFPRTLEVRISQPFQKLKICIKYCLVLNYINLGAYQSKVVLYLLSVQFVCSQMESFVKNRRSHWWTLQNIFAEQLTRTFEVLVKGINPIHISTYFYKYIVIAFAFYSIHITYNICICILFDSNSAKGLLWACLGCSEGQNSFFVTPRLGANYYLVRNTLKWV